MKTVRTLAAVLAHGYVVPCDTLIEVDDAVADALTADGMVDGHPDTVAYCLSRGDVARNLVPQLEGEGTKAPAAPPPEGEAKGLTTETAAPIATKRAKKGG